MQGMTNQEFREALTDLGLPQTLFAKIIGTDPRTVRRYAHTPKDGGEPFRIPNAVALLVRLFQTDGQILDLARKLSR